MPMLDAVFVGKIYLPEVSTGPVPPGSGGGQPPTVMPPIYYPPVFPAHPISGPPEWGHHPAHPIAPGGPPPVAGWTPPGYHPAHPIAPGGPPPGIWGPPGPWPTPPIYLPPAGGGGEHPAHPIVIPMPPGAPGSPEHPIVIPPPVEGGPERKLEVNTVWTERTGWFIVAVPAEGTEVPVPSEKKK